MSDAYDRLRLKGYTLPAQHEPEWFELRFRSANSSAYEDYFNAWGKRDQELQKAAKRVRTEPNYYMSFGTTFERTSGYLFTAITGLEYAEIGSVGHPSNDRIRGSVDGYGLDKDGRMFILETKTPSKRMPSSAIPHEGYLYQVIQNIEIADASYGYFNDVRLLPCATSDFCHPSLARDPVYGNSVYATYARHQFAKASEKKITMVFLRIYPTEETLRSDNYHHWWIDNIFDAFSGAHHKLTMVDVTNLITQLVYKFVPVAHTTVLGDDVRPWVETLIDESRDLIEDYCAGYAVMRVDAHLIQKIYRNKQFWEDQLKPVAEEWLSDLDKVAKGEEVEATPKVDHDDLPWPDDDAGTVTSEDTESDDSAVEETETIDEIDEKARNEYGTKSED